MMPMMWMLMAQTIMSAITTACFLSRVGAGERARSKQHATAGPPPEASGATARGRYTRPRLHHGAAAAALAATKSAVAAAAAAAAAAAVAAAAWLPRTGCRDQISSAGQHIGQ